MSCYRGLGHLEGWKNQNVSHICSLVWGRSKKDVSHYSIEASDPGATTGSDLFPELDTDHGTRASFGTRDSRPWWSISGCKQLSLRILILSCLTIHNLGTGLWGSRKLPVISEAERTTFIGAVCFSKETTLTCLASSSGREALSCIYRPTT